MRLCQTCSQLSHACSSRFDNSCHLFILIIKIILIKFYNLYLDSYYLFLKFILCLYHVLTLCFKLLEIIFNSIFPFSSPQPLYVATVMVEGSWIELEKKDGWIDAFPFHFSWFDIDRATFSLLFHSIFPSNSYNYRFIVIHLDEPLLGCSFWDGWWQRFLSFEFCLRWCKHVFHNNTCFFACFCFAN